MKCCSHIQMQFFSIRAPRYRDRVVLLKDQKLGVHNKIVFTDAPSMGTEPYYISRGSAKKQATEFMETRDGRKIKMRVVPEDELERLEINKKGCEHLI